MARSTQKKKAKTGNTLQDFIFTLSTISNLYERQGDAGRAKSFEVASENLTKFAELTKKSGTVLKSSADYKNVKGVGKSTLEMMDEFIKTGTCSRLEELEGAGKQVALRSDEVEEADLELGVFRYEDTDEFALFLYDPGMALEERYPLYNDICATFEEKIEEEESYLLNKAMSDGERHFKENVKEDCLECCAGYEYLSLDYRNMDWEQYFFVRKATAKDRKQKDWALAGDADPNWQKPKRGDSITRDDLRDLVLAGKNEDKHTEALEQLYQEEDAFLKHAEKDLKKALELFPYKKMTYTLEDGLGLLRGIDEKDQARCFEWGKYKMYVTTVSHDHDEATVHIKCEDFDDTLTCGRWCCECLMWDNGNDECHSFTTDEYLQSLNPEGDLERLVYDIFEPFDLKDVPE